MNLDVPNINLLLAWTGIVAGFGFGAFLGLGFHREDWLGGYASHRRRLYRLAHISFFGLALLNLAFYFSSPLLAGGSIAVEVASWGFAVGAITMPVCCLLMAHQPRWRMLFGIPVGSLMTAGLITLWEVANL